MSDLDAIEAFLDAAPRSGARVEEHGPFTLFVSRAPWPYYARPRLGCQHAFTAADVDAVRARQRALGEPEHFAWVHENAPSLRAAMTLPVIEVPLLVLDPARRRAPEPPADVALRELGPSDPALPAALAVAEVGFGAPGTAAGPQGRPERDDAMTALAAPMIEYTRTRLRKGLSVMVVAESEAGPVAAGTLRPLGAVAEIVAVATLPAVRRQGLGAAVTGALVEHALHAGVRTVFLSAADDEIARVYERLGFRRAGTACFVQ